MKITNKCTLKPKTCISVKILNFIINQPTNLISWWMVFPEKLIVTCQSRNYLCLRNIKDHYPFHSGPSLNPILNHLNSFPTNTPYLWTIPFVIVLPSIPIHMTSSFEVSEPKFCMNFSSHLFSMPCPSHFLV